jgi:hypothetical protein
VELSFIGFRTGAPNIRFLMHQTVLSPVASQPPAVKGEMYMALLPVFEWNSNEFFATHVTNRSDDAWMPDEIWIFGFNKDFSGGRFLGRNVEDFRLISQDPHDRFGTNIARQDIVIPRP